MIRRRHFFSLCSVSTLLRAITHRLSLSARAMADLAALFARKRGSPSHMRAQLLPASRRRAAGVGAAAAAFAEAGAHHHAECMAAAGVAAAVIRRTQWPWLCPWCSYGCEYVVIVSVGKRCSGVRPVYDVP